MMNSDSYGGGRIVLFKLEVTNGVLVVRVLEDQLSVFGLEVRVRDQNGIIVSLEVEVHLSQLEVRMVKSDGDGKNVVVFL